MRIIQLCGSPSWGGMEMQTIGISEALLAAGQDCLIACSPASHIEQNCIKKKLPYQSIVWGSKKLFGSVSAFRQLIKTYKPDIIHVERSHDLAIASFALLFIKRPIILVFTRRMESRHKKRSIIHQLIYRRIDRTWCISEFIRENTLKTTPLKANRVFVMHNGIDIDQYNSHTIDREHIREQLGIQKGSLAIGILGRISPMKGHKEFIEAAAMVLNKTKLPLQFVIIGGASHGEDDFGEEVLAYAKNTIPSENLIITGFRSDTKIVLGALDILVFPSHRESFGNVLLEGMAMELAIVSSNSGGVPDILDDNLNAICVPPYDPKGFADGIMRYINDPDMRESHGKAARKKVMEQFRYDTFINRLLSEYRELLLK